ncbi:MAG: hypothetical protein RLZZ175_3170 [Bacteroidota bacterium]|jgi:hypothetical protein
MKKQLLILATLCISYFATAQVGVGTTTPHASAVLDVTSTTQGFLPPRMTQAQRDAIASPASGLMVWCTNCGASGEFQGYNGTTWVNLTGGTATGATISSITCGSATNNGTLTSGTAASGVSSNVPYTGGNAGTHSGQTVTSTGVTGLTATLSAGTFASGSGSLTYNITGTPASSGTATFALNIGGQTCSLTRTVAAGCGSTVTFTYNGASVTYGTVTGANSKCWLDRNLGATRVATGSTDHLAYGDLFQWGRGTDGHQRITWTNATTGTAANSTTATLSSSDTPGNALFITINSGNYDWRSPQNNNLWQGVSGTNNPCPSGYRLPTETELEAERASWGANNNATGAINSPLKLPMSGYRGYSTASILSVGTLGCYWSSTVSGSNSRYLDFNNSNAIMLTDRRAYGFAVRCIKD